jgi:pyruvate dehydrogenase E2 component (dihydrolipoamide acetyltransferase)
MPEGVFRMPSLGADMTEGRVVEWHVGPGDEVHRGDIVASVDTSKAEIDVEIFEDGVIEELLVGVGETVPVGTPLARLAGAAAPAPAPPAPAPAAVAETVAPAAAAAAAVAGTDGAGRVRATPVARRMARELHVDLGGLVGTGPHGAIRMADVERAAAAAAPPPPVPAPPPAAAAAPAAPPAAAAPAAAMRRAIGDLMARSKREVPHYYLATDIDLARALAWLAEANAQRPIAERILPAALLLAASARAAGRYPDLNGFWVDGAFRPGSGVHLGVAVSLRGGGLVAPAIHDADAKGPAEIMAVLRDLVARARRGKLTGSEMADPTITVTNLGEHGTDVVYGVIYAPQVALIGFGAIRERPWAQDGMLAARPVATATLSADHRASDGHRGALLLAEIDRLLQAPEEL